MRIILSVILTLLSFTGIAQVFQTNNSPFKFRGLKADTVLIVPASTDTPYMANPKWGTSATGALHLRTSDSTLWVKIGDTWRLVGGNGAISSDTTILAPIIDSTGQEAYRVLFAVNNRIYGSNFFRYDSVNKLLVVPNIGVEKATISNPATDYDFGFARPLVMDYDGAGSEVKIGLNLPIPDTTVNMASKYSVDTAKANIRAAIPAQFNPIAGTNISLSGTYPNITFNASGGVTNDSAILNRAARQDKEAYIRDLRADTLTGGRFSLIKDSIPITTSNIWGLTLDTASNRVQRRRFDNLAWSLTGNAGTDPSTNFIGTTDNRSLRFRTNNIERFVLDSATGAMVWPTDGGRTWFRSNNLSITYSSSPGSSMTINGNWIVNGLSAIPTLWRTTPTTSQRLWDVNGTQTSGNQTHITKNYSFGNTVAWTANPSHTTNAYGSLHAYYDSTIFGASTSNRITKNYSFYIRSTYAGSDTMYGYYYDPIFTSTPSQHVAMAINTGRVGIGTVAPSASARLEVSSTNQGVLLPRLNTTQQNAISTPATGLLIWNTDSLNLTQYTGTAWRNVGGGGGGGSTGIDTVFIQNDTLRFRRNSVLFASSPTDTATVVKAYVRNAESFTINKGQVVYLWGATGDKAAVKLAKNTSDTFSSKTFAIVREDIPAGGEGWVVSTGQVAGLNLGSYTSGDILWLDSIPGGITKVKPEAPYHNVFLGVVERANTGNGVMYVKIQNGYELDELHNVKITSPTNNQVLTYTASTGLWENKSVTTALGYTPVSVSDTATMLAGYARNDEAILNTTTKENKNLHVIRGQFDTVRASASAGLNIAASNGTSIADFGASNSSTATFNGNVNVAGQLDMTATNAAFRMPRLTSAQRTALTPLTGMMVFDTDSAAVFWYSGTAWIKTANDDHVKTSIYTIEKYQAMGSGLKAVTIPVETIANTRTMSDGILEASSVHVPRPITVSSIWYYQGATGVYTGDNENRVGIYSVSGGTATLVASSANDSELWKSTANAFKKVNLSSSVTLQPGLYYIAGLYNQSAQTTAPTIGGFNTTSGNVLEGRGGLFTNNNSIRFVLTGQNTLPATITLSTTGFQITNPFFGIE